MSKYISKKLKNKDKADGNTDILYRIEYWSSSPIFVYGVGKTIEEAVANVGILDSKGKPKYVKSYYIINNWPHLKSVDPIIRSYKSPYNRPVFVTSNFNCYYDEYLDECFVVSKTTGHSITLKNK
jgi:hypothetical protein